MPKIHKNKQEIRAYFESNNETPTQVSKKFNLPLRTLNHWIQTEGWEQARAIKDVLPKVVQSRLINREFGSAMAAESKRVEAQVLQNLGDTAYQIDEIVLRNILRDSTDKLLLNAMSLNWIQKNIALSAVVARNELLKMVEISEQTGKVDPLIVASAEKVQKLLIDLKTATFGKDFVAQNEAEVDYTTLSDAELNAILSKN